MSGKNVPLKVRDPEEAKRRSDENRARHWASKERLEGDEPLPEMPVELVGEEWPAVLRLDVRRFPKPETVEAALEHERDPELYAEMLWQVRMFAQHPGAGRRTKHAFFVLWFQRVHGQPAQQVVHAGDEKRPVIIEIGVRGSGSS